MPERPTTAPRRRSLAEGHRQRLRARLERAGLDALEDYEILEFLLGLAIRGRDVKPLAKGLLKAFGGSFSRVLSATRKEITAVKGAGDAVADALLAARAASIAAHRDRAGRGDALSDPAAVAEYCRARFAAEPQEVVVVLLLDARHRVAQTRLISRGTVDRAAAFPGEVARVALKEGVAAVILAHNHPSGSPQPSEQDRAFTRDVDAALRTVGIRLVDHVVVGREGCSSLKLLGVL